MNGESPRRTLVERITSSLQRDSGLPLLQKVSKGARYALATASAPIYLRACDAVGPRARTMNEPVVKNLGRISIGRGAILNSMFVPIELSTGPAGSLEIGDDVAVNFGARISAVSSIKIGNRTAFGPHVTIADHDGEFSGDEDPRPIVIGDDVWLATRVTVKKGAVIGDGVVVTAGSVVHGELAPGVIAGGSPARVIGYRNGAPPKAPVVAKAVAEAIAPKAQVRGPASDLTGVLVSDFSIQELADHLRRRDDLGTTVESEVAPFDQVVQTLHSLAAGQIEPRPDFAVVWTRVEGIAPFRALLAGEQVSSEAIDAAVDGFIELVKRAAAGVRFILLPGWILPPYHRGFGMRDMKRGGAASTLMRMNLRLADGLAETSNVHVLDATRWIEAAGKTAVSAKLWYLGKVGYSSEVFAEAARDIKAALRGVRGSAKKLIVLDLDDTLWGGIVGDVGWQNLRLGGHDGVGEALVDFQRELKALSRRGITLAVVSKNEESVALEAIKSHPEMVLGLGDISAYRINWKDKARNIVEIADELNLGMQSIVFIDDNPVERARVREALPEVFVPEWPEDHLLYASTLLSLRCFDTPVVSKEDAQRSGQYADEKEREQLRAELGSLDDWLDSLGIRVSFAPLDANNVVRTTQLLNKTNQMNLSTRRLNEVELEAWAREPGHEVWAVSVSDKIGDAGLTGILALSIEGRRATIVDYVLSCRVMGRKVEETLVAVAVARARKLGAEEVVAKFLPTAKNMPCLTFWKNSGFTHDEATSTFHFDTARDYTLPRCITLDGLDIPPSTEVRHVA